MEQRISNLSDEEAARLEAQRKWVREHYEPEAQQKYETVEGKLELIDAIVANGWIEPHETVKLQSLGVAFGDALAQELDLRWVTIEDEYGRDPALVLDGTSIKVFPLTTISKRIEAGEEVDVLTLFAKACATLLDVIKEQAQ
jgi:Domain of unknown function (DUF3806)